MKNINRSPLIFLIVIFLLSLISCKSIPQKLDRIEKEYSKEVRNEIEAIEDLELLDELLNNEDEIEAIHNRFLKLNEVEKEYSPLFREVLEKIKDSEYLDKILSDSETIKLLYDVFLWQKDWTNRILNFRYENDEIKLIINTVGHIRDDDRRRVEYLEILQSITVNNYSYPLSLEEISDIFKRSFDAEYPFGEMNIIFDEIEDYGYSFTLKMYEIKDQYGLDFYEYLETLDNDYLIDILDDEEILKEKYNNFTERIDFYEYNIVFEVEDNMFPGYWYYAPRNVYAESLLPNNIERVKIIAFSALDKYTIKVLVENLKKIYFLNDFEFYGFDWGGTIVLPSETLYLVCYAWSLDYWIEKNIHHEFSHLLFYKYRYLFDEISWNNINPEGFSYLPGEGREALEKGMTSKEFDKKLHETGFLFEYAQSGILEDIASFAENMFLDNPDFWHSIETYPKLKQKFGLVVDFYHSIDPTFTEEYFREISRQLD